MNSVKAAVNGPTCILILNHKASLIRFRCFQPCLLLIFSTMSIFWKLSSVLKNHSPFWHATFSRYTLGSSITFSYYPRPFCARMSKSSQHFWFDHWLLKFSKKWQNQLHLFSVPVKTEKKTKHQVHVQFKFWFCIARTRMIMITNRYNTGPVNGRNHSIYFNC